MKTKAPLCNSCKHLHLNSRGNPVCLFWRLHKSLSATCGAHTSREKAAA